MAKDYTWTATGDLELGAVDLIEVAGCKSQAAVEDFLNAVLPTMEGYIAPKPCTAVYCNDCAETRVPLRPRTGDIDRDIGRHWQTDFKWAPRYGAPCHACGKDC